MGRAGCKASHRAGGAAARWGHRALPQLDRVARGYAAIGHGEGARQRDRAAAGRGRWGAGDVRFGTGVAVFCI